MKVKELVNHVVDLSREVGIYILNERKSFDPSKTEEKSFNNLVSYVDKTAEKLFIKGLKALLPEAGYIAEESDDIYRKEEYNWIIDPLDGTTNFIFDLPFFCTSVALMHNEKLVLGVIFDPVHNECFYATIGNGAFLNGISIEVSKTKKLIRSLVATGFPYDDFNRVEEYIHFLGTLTKKTKGIRRLGSAALDLAYVACGRFDTFYEYGLNAWDVAAGALIVQEAGGLVSDFKNGGDFIFGEEILTGNKDIHHEMLEEIQTYF
jgi:myo-inositol-1(or 4)-monophosphatase